MASRKNNFYKTLGVAPNASDEEIKKAFRRLAMEYHPDRNPNAGAAGRFKEVNEAYQVLSDPEKRARYDRFGEAGVGAGNGGFGRGFEGFEDLGGFGDIFDAFFGGFGATTRRSAQRGTDLQARVTLSFEEAVFGCEKEVEVSRTETCPWCGGKGAEPGSQPLRCSNCGGRGRVRRSHQSLFGQFVQVVPCTVCRGAGQVIKDRCHECAGKGQKERTRRIAVGIPAGIEDGFQVRLRGEGDAGVNGGGPGNLYISVMVEPHHLFRRENANILYELPINIAQAALGDTLEVPTLEGEESLKIPSGTQSGQVFRLKGKGVPHLGGKGRGDQVVMVKVVIPISLDENQRRLLQELANVLEKPQSNGGPEDRHWFSRIRDAFNGD